MGNGEEGGGTYQVLTGFGSLWKTSAYTLFIAAKFTMSVKKILTCTQLSILEPAASSTALRFLRHCLYTYPLPPNKGAIISYGYTNLHTRRLRQGGSRLEQVGMYLQYAQIQILRPSSGSGDQRLWHRCSRRGLDILWLGRRKGEVGERWWCGRLL